MKRVLAALLCLMLTAVPALAAQDNVQQIKQWGSSTPAGWYDSVTHTHNDANLKLSEDGVAVSKTITPTEHENYFDITLKVASEYTYEKLIREPSVDVVIVLDKSNTMNQKMNDTTRIEAAKASAVSFINGFYSNDMFSVDDKHRLAFVTFNTHAETVFALDSGLSKANMIKKINSIDITTDSSSPERFTNIEAGLRLAQNLLKGSTADNKFIVFISDGFPTTYIASGKNSTTKITGYNPTTASSTQDKDGVFADRMTGQANNAGTNYSDRAALYAQNAAKAIKDSGINIYSIGIDIGTTTVWNYLWRNGSYYPTIDRFSEAYYKQNGNTYVIGEPVVKYANKKDPGADYTGKFKAWLKNKISGGPDCPEGLYADGDTPSDLTKALQDILAEIIEINSKEIAESWVVSDPMNEHIDFQYFYDKNGNPDTNGMSGSNAIGSENSVKLQNGNAIAWKLFESGYRTATVDGRNVYIYELKYRIRLSNEAATFINSEHKTLETNGKTTFEYKIIENNEITEEDVLEFEVPAIEGYLAEIYFVKENSDTHTYVEGAEFTLTHAPECPVCGGDAKFSKYTSVSTKVEIDGQSRAEVRFKNIPSGHTYWLEETNPAPGYDNTFEKRLVEVAYEQVLRLDDILHNGVFNQPIYKPVSITLPVKKVVAEGDVFAKADMQKFVFELYACDENGNVTGSALASKNPDADGNVTFAGIDAFTFSGYEDADVSRYFLIKEKPGDNLYIDYDTEHEYLIEASASIAESASADGVHSYFPLVAAVTTKVREIGGAWETYTANAPVFTNTDKVSGLTFVKKNADTGAALGGAVFTLTHASDCEACGSGAQALTFSATSAQDGVVTFTNIPAGHDYELEETKAPIGYQISFAKRRVHVTNDGVTNFEDIAAAGIANTPVYQLDAITVPVQKIVAEEDVFAKADMQNFVFELYACDENGNAVGEALASMNPDANGDLVFEGIDEFVFDDYADKDAVRYFLVKEKAGLNPYIDYDTEHEYLITATAELSEQPVEAAGAFVLTASTTIKVRENGGAWQDYAADTAAFTNADKVSGLAFVKKNADTGAVLGGAVFTLTHADNCEACGGRAKINVFTATSDQDGKVSFGDIPAGHDYMLEETKAPVGYEISFSKRLVQIDENGPKNFEDIASSGIADQPIYQPAQITIPVKKIVGETDVYAKADMQKFVFELYACDETGAVAGEALASENPDAEGNVLFEGLDEFLFGDYADSQETRYFLIKEKHGGSPFIQYDDERAYLVTASAALSETPDEEIGAFVITAETTVRIRETEKGVWEAFGGEAPVFVNSDLGRSGFEFTKLSSFNDRGLNGAEFTLTHSGKCECGYTHVEIPAIVVESVDGKVVFGDQVETEILTGHSYTLKETKAPNGFELMNGTTYTVAIDAQGNVTITRNETSGGKPIEGDLFVARGLFQNTPKYEVKTQIEARKLYNNEIPPKSGERYTFALFDQEITENKFGYLNTESTMKEVKATPGFIETVQNDEQGRILFTPMTFDRAGTYTYWMLEIPGYEADVSYDRTIFKVTITVDEKVNEDGSGTPVIEYAYEIVGQDKLEEGRETFVDGLPTFNNYILPNTGDESSLLLWMLVLAGAGSVIAVMLLMRRRKAN